MLKEKELAIVVSRLQVPLVVADIMRGESELTPDVQYGLHEVISDLQPDSALLCIALSVRKIAGAHSSGSPAMCVLEMECDRIIEDYAALWLQNAEQEDVDEDEAMEMVSRTAEDLEGMAELLDLNFSFFRDKDKAAADLCQVMSIQARAHALIAETYCEAIDEALTQVPGMAQKMVPMVAGDNVIPFPSKRN